MVPVCSLQVKLDALVNSSTTSDEMLHSFDLLLL
jgi:hypothetical protein